MSLHCRRFQESISKIEERPVIISLQHAVSGKVKQHTKYEPRTEAGVEQLYCSMSSHLDYHPDLLVGLHWHNEQGLFAWWPELQSASQANEVCPMLLPFMALHSHPTLVQLACMQRKITAFWRISATTNNPEVKTGIFWFNRM